MEDNHILALQENASRFRVVREIYNLDLAKKLHTYRYLSYYELITLCMKFFLDISSNNHFNQ